MGRKRGILALVCALATLASGYNTPDSSATREGLRLATRRAFARPLVAATGLLWGEAARAAVPTYDEYLVGQPGSGARTRATPKPPAKGGAAAMPAATNRLSSLSAGKLPPLVSLAELKAALVTADTALVALEPMIEKQVCCSKERLGIYSFKWVARAFVHPISLCLQPFRRTGTAS